MENTNLFYVYIHSRPNGIPFYVGKGTKFRTTYIKRYNSFHEKIVKKHGIKNIKVVSYECETENQAFELEKEIIFILKNLLNLKLANFTNGGEGTSGLVQTKAHIKNRFTEERNKKASDSLRIEKFYGFNSYWS